MVTNERLHEPLSPAKHARLEKIFEHAKKSPNDFDYVTELLTQCVLGEPGNINYVRNHDIGILDDRGSLEGDFISLSHLA